MSDCSIIGNPKPSRSPHYKNCEQRQYQEKVLCVTLHDYAWLLACYFQQHHSEEMADGIPVWAAHNFQLCTKDDRLRLAQDFSLPVINEPAHEWRTLVTVLEKLSYLNCTMCPENPGKVLVTLDIYFVSLEKKSSYLYNS